MQTFALKSRDASRTATSAHASPVRRTPEVRHILRAPQLQTKLKIGAVDDPAEREADRVADQVMRMPARDFVGEGPPPARPGTAISPVRLTGIQRMCPACEHEAQRKENGGAGREGGSAAPETEARVAALGSGAPLPASERTFFEPRFGRSLANVRVHSGGAADEAARAVNARAFTLGDDITFAAGELRPGTLDGRRLIAHELTHTLQQGAASPGDTTQRSPALDIRRRLNLSRIPQATLQRTFDSWAGTFTPDTYQELNEAGVDGVDMKLRFTPNPSYADATRIGLVQAAQPTEQGRPIQIGSAADQAVHKARQVPAGQAEAGFEIDQYTDYSNPLYQAGQSTATQTLGTTPEQDPVGVGQYGYRYVDAAGKEKKQDATLIDPPALSSTRKETKIVFETAALAVAGNQAGIYYGSVEWGWQKNAAGKVTKLPFRIVDKYAPSINFFHAKVYWGQSKTLSGVPTLKLPP
jgi:hypothetical protein